MPVRQEDNGEDTVALTDGTGRRPRRKTAVSASKSLRAVGDGPDAPSSDDEYQGDTEQEAEEANTDEDDVDTPTDDEDNE